MFEEIKRLINERNYKDASGLLESMRQGENAQTTAYACYLLGYINTRLDNKAKNSAYARRCLRENIYSNYPHPYSYVLYSRVEEDENIALNHLQEGLKRFPNDAKILNELLLKSPDKDRVVNLIKDSGLNTPDLMGRVIDYLIHKKRWDQINRYLFRIESSGELEKDECCFLELIKAYVCLFRDNPDFSEAQCIFENVISEDINNKLSYSHYLGMIYSSIKQGDTEKAKYYFDRLPVNNTIEDFDERPWPFNIYINFEKEYEEIFKSIIELFKNDNTRKLKAQTLYSLYLYHPSEMFDIYRFKKTDATTVARYLKTTFNTKVAVALYNMRCHLKQFKEAYSVLWRFLEEGDSPMDSWITLHEVFEDADEQRLKMLTEQTVHHLQERNYDEEIFVNEVFSCLIKELHQHKMSFEIREVASFVADKEIIKSNCAFECAYAFGDTDADRATAIYEGLVEKEPNNSSAINNLGVKYREKGELYKALFCYEKASLLSPDEELYQNNLRIIRKSIEENLAEEIGCISDNICLEVLQDIGYTTDLCKKIASIQDAELRSIIQRDLRECAIAVIAKQDKLATIMCGSIAEALLLYKITEKKIEKYDVTPVNPRRQNASNVPVKDMMLNELLHVAHQEHILDAANYHLGHYLRDYRNMIHPSKELRAKEDINHENVITMWSVLVRLISYICVC